MGISKNLGEGTMSDDITIRITNQLLSDHQPEVSDLMRLLEEALAEINDLRDELIETVLTNAAGFPLPVHKLDVNDKT